MLNNHTPYMDVNYALMHFEQPSKKNLFWRISANSRFFTVNFLSFVSNWDHWINLIGTNFSFVNFIFLSFFFFKKSISCILFFGIKHMLLLLYSPTGVACPIPPIPDEGFVINFGRRYPVILEYYCNNGYVLKGNRTVKCLKNQTWDKEFPTCIGKLLLFFIVTILHSSYKLLKIYLYIL